MPRPKRPPWHIRREPIDLRYSFFISHVAEDNEDVIRLKSEVEARSKDFDKPGLNCYLDVHDWSFGLDNAEVIRDACCSLRTWSSGPARVT